MSRRQVSFRQERKNIRQSPLQWLTFVRRKVIHKAIRLMIIMQCDTQMISLFTSLLVTSNKNVLLETFMGALIRYDLIIAATLR